jgi:hypothetical protein
MQLSKEKDIKINNAMVKRKRYKDKQCNGQKKRRKGRTLIYKTPNLLIEQHDLHYICKIGGELKYCGRVVLH